MNTQQATTGSFLKEIMRRQKRLPSQLAADLGVSHASVSRWLSGKDIPNIRSCRRLAERSGVPLQKVLSFAGYLPEIDGGPPADWPEFGEYARQKYPELDEDLIVVIEDLIERRRRRNR